MAGIYIHIPFCKQACHYCDFHFSTSNQAQNDLTKAILQEIFLQKDYLENPLKTIYFGGGTPSILPINLLEQIINEVYKNFTVEPDFEFTLEANPDDLNKEKLKLLRKLGVNRLSIGIQSFQDEILKFLNRAHNTIEALTSIENAKNAGFEKINVDLIYGIVEDNHSSLKKDLDLIGQILPDHISAYSLTIEPKTTFGNWLQKGKLKMVSEEYAALQFELTAETLGKFQFEQYEVSNFAHVQSYSMHNTNYWKGEHYLGIGPSAHSFNGKSRQYNVANNAKYIRSLKVNILPFEREILDNKTQANEQIMTGLRTKWGCDLNLLKDKLGYDLLIQNEMAINNYIENGLLIVNENKVLLSKKGWLLADEIIAELFWV